MARQLSMRKRIVLLILWPPFISALIADSITVKHSAWHLSFQYLGLTYHPDGGSTPEVYPLKLDRKAYLVLDVGLVANIDYRLADYSFLRFTTAVYQDCAFVTAGAVHAGP